MNPFRCMLWTAALAVLMFPPGAARAIEEPPRPPASAISKIRDLAATVRVRRSLEEDRDLAKLNLGVWVENGTVSVWGPVPSDEVGRQAVARLGAVKGVARVRPNFYLSVPDGGKRLELVRPAGVPERIEAAKPEIETGQLPAPARAHEPAGDGPRLLAPRAVTVGRPEAPAAVVRLPRAEVSLSDQVRETQRSERRFRGISVRVEGQSVVVGRGEAGGRDVMDLVGKLRRIDGVSDVILSDE